MVEEMDNNRLTEEENPNLDSPCKAQKSSLVREGRHWRVCQRRDRHVNPLRIIHPSSSASCLPYRRAIVVWPKTLNPWETERGVVVECSEIGFWVRFSGV
jgi:hypothetical protein